MKGDRHNMNVNIDKKQAMIEKDLARLAQFRLMDDDFFSEALDGKIEAVQFIVDTILGCGELRVIQTDAQVEYKSAVRRSIKLDIRAVSKDGRLVDIEIQRYDQGTGAKRARYHSSAIDRTLLYKRDDFEDLVDTYVIFIMENDKFKTGLPIYHIERTIDELNHAPFGDGAHIIYVNGEFQDLGHPIGRLMHDFNCKDASDMLNPVLAREVSYLKEEEGGINHMCKILEDMRKEAAIIAKEEGKAEGKVEGERQGTFRAIQTLMESMNMSAEQAMEALKIPESEMPQYWDLLQGQR
jgi:predicted transposase/invertase (TIGR01784 family)